MGGSKPEKKILNPQEKLAAITRVNERGESKASVARDLGIPESTLRGWCKNSQRINYQSSRSSPDTDDALKLSPNNNRSSSSKRKSFPSLSASSSKKRGRRPNSPNLLNANHLLVTTSNLSELNRLKAEYGLTRTNDYLTQSSSLDTNTNSLDTAMRGWALQMQMLLQASMAASPSSDLNNTSNTPIMNQGSNVSSSTSNINTSTSSMLNQLWAPLIDTTTCINNSLYPSTITAPSTSTSSTLPLNLNFPTSSSNSLLMSYLPTSLMDPTSLNANPAVPTSLKSPKYHNLSPHYHQTPKCPWRTNSPTGFSHNFGSSASSSGSTSPKSRTSLNSQGFNDVYYGTDEEIPVLPNLSPSNEETSSDSSPVIPQTPIDFSNHLHAQSDEVQTSTAPKSEEVPPPQSETSENSDRSSIEETTSPKLASIKPDEVEKSKESCSDGHRKNLESVLATVFQVTNNNNTIVSLDEERQKAISISEAIECGEVFLKFLETAADPNVTASQITQFRHILGSIKAGCAQKSGERKPKVSRK